MDGWMGNVSNRMDSLACSHCYNSVLGSLGSSTETLNTKAIVRFCRAEGLFIFFEFVNLTAAQGLTHSLIFSPSNVKED